MLDEYFDDYGYLRRAPEPVVVDMPESALEYLSLTPGPVVTVAPSRKDEPVYSGVMAYFPLAMKALARLSKWGNDKHNPGQPLHWSRPKSSDHKDCIARHLLDAGTIDPESGELHDVALAWRALANLQLAEEKRLGLNVTGDVTV